jgi:hypothetical protein
MATRLLIDSFEFLGFEVPDSITFGGSQSLAIHKLPGGVRIIDSNGRDDAPIEWSGIFTGADALNRVQYLDGYRAQGQIHKLTLGTFSYNIVIKEFRPRFERAWHIPYHIVCEVVEDLNNPTTALTPSVSLDTSLVASLNAAEDAAAALLPSIAVTTVDMVAARDAVLDAAAKARLSTTLKIPDASLFDTIANGLKTVQAAVANVQSIMTRAMQGIASVVNLETAVIVTIQSSITDTLITVNGASVMINNGLLQLTALFANPLGYSTGSGESAGVQSATLISTWQIDSVNQATLSQIRASLTVATRNLGFINGAPNATQVTMFGGNLAVLALKYYGDATQWPLIAAANGMTDPIISGQQTITIPPAANTPSAPGAGVDIDHWIGADVSLTSQNDLVTASNATQRQQRILRRILTNPGDYLWHPTYGAGVMQYIGDIDNNLQIIEGLINSQVQLEQGATSPSVTFTSVDGEVIANIQYTDQDTGGLQFLSFTVTP